MNASGDTTLGKVSVPKARILADLVAEYLTLTQDTMPLLAIQKQNTRGVKPWPVKHDHCFQRIVLDNICGDAWCSVIKTPAYKHLNTEQATAAVALCHQIINEDVALSMLNTRSLNWRKKQSTFNFAE